MDRKLLEFNPTKDFILRQHLLNYSLNKEPKSLAFLTERFAPLVISIAKQFTEYPLGSLEEAVQYGYIGLISALQNYKDSKKDTFCSFAYSCIRNAILNEIRSQTKQQENHPAPKDWIEVKTSTTKNSQLFDFIGGLEPQEQQTIIEIFQNKNDRETASKKMKISINQFNSIYRKAIRKIKEDLQEGRSKEK